MTKETTLNASQKFFIRSVLFWANAPLVYLYWWLFAEGQGLPGRVHHALNGPLPDAPALALAWNFCAFAMFGFSHSFMAARPFKRWFESRFHKAYTRGLYSIVSGIALTVVVLVWRPVGPTLFKADAPALRIVLGAAYWAAIFGVMFTSSFFNMGEFTGVSQVKRLARGEAIGEMEFQVRGPFAWCRHPIYFCTMMGVWMTPTLTADRLEMNLIVALYLWIGLHFEEKRMTHEIGEPFERYCQTTPKLIPRPPKKAAPGCSDAAP